MRFAFKENSLNKENGSTFFYFFSFDKTVTPISNLAHLFFAKNRQKTKELNCPPKHIGFASQVFAHLTPFGQRSSRQREFHPKPLTEPYVKLSLHTALVIQAYKTINRPLIKHSWITDLNFL